MTGMDVRTAVCRVLVGNVRERDHLLELGVNEVLILKGMLLISVGEHGLH
jgi:hypothetical protein